MMKMILFSSEGLSIFGIRLYAICILIGIILAVWLGIREGKRLGINKDFIFLGVVITVPISIIGARLWYVLFNRDSFHSFAEICGFYNGQFRGLSGLGVQGSFIAAIITVFIYCKVRKESFLKVLDIVAPGFFIGQICGRWGNFFNSELYGPAVSNVVVFKTILPSFITENMYINGMYRHPTFLYESLLNLVGLCIMFYLRNKSKKMQIGDLVGFYLVWYGMVRIFTESLRMHSGVSEPLMLGNMPVSIAMSVLFIVVGAIVLVLKHTIAKFKMPLYLEYKNFIKNEAIDTLVFDLDGTLLDTKPLIDHSFIYTFQHFFPEHKLTDEELETFFGPTLEVTFSKYEKDPKKIDEMIEYFRVYNREHHDEFVKAFPTVRETLKTLHMKGYRITIVSSKVKEMVNYGLMSTGLLPYVDYVIGEGEVKPKPDPEGIVKIMNTFKYAKNGLYIGDHPSDIIAGKKTNEIIKKDGKSMKTCAVKYSTKLQEVLDQNPNYTISKMEDLLEILNI